MRIKPHAVATLNMTNTRFIIVPALIIINLLQVAGCGGSSVEIISGPPTPVPTATALPTPTLAQPVLTPAPPPGVVFDLRGRVLLAGTPLPGAIVRAVGAPGSVTVGETETMSDSTGRYSFFLGTGTYTLSVSSGGRSFTRTIFIPPGGQAVDNIDLNL